MAQAMVKTRTNHKCNNNDKDKDKKESKTYQHNIKTDKNPTSSILVRKTMVKEKNAQRQR